MKFKNVNLEIGDFVLVTENYDIELEKKLIPKRRHIGIIRNIEDWNGDKSITITNKDLKNYQEKIKGFKDLFLTCKLWRNIGRTNFGIWSTKSFIERQIESIKKLK